MNLNKEIGCSLLTFIAARKKSEFVTPGISCGYCIARNNPATLLSFSTFLYVHLQIFRPNLDTANLVGLQFATFYQLVDEIPVYPQELRNLADSQQLIQN